MSLEKQRVATYADIEALPPNMVGQILYGVLYAQPRPAPRHARASSILGGELIGPFDQGRDGPGGWILLDEPELHLADHVVVPDIAGWRAERFPNAAAESQAYLSIAPDWVSEVLSPSTQQIDRTDKLSIYASFGVAHAWYIDPLAQTLEVLERDGSTYKIARTFKNSDNVCAPPFEAHTFCLANLWLPSASGTES
ncbi:MAG: Uma2 family endonuclease [Pseudomonadota bacterium]